MDDSFQSNVFINCPFDKEYKTLLRPLLFTILYLKLSPCIASKSCDSGHSRLDKIRQLIEVSKYSIHDLSRNKSSKKGETLRFNMPFELGLDMGCRWYHEDKKYREKKCLVFEGKKYSSKKALSDLGGMDAKCHKLDAETLVSELRDWFLELGINNVDSGSKIWDKFNEFSAYFHEERKSKGFKKKDILKIPDIEYLSCIEKWLKDGMPSSFSE